MSDSGIMLNAPPRFVETDLCPGDPVFVLATAMEERKGGGDDRVVIRSSIRCPLMICQSGELRLLSLLSRRAKQRFAAGTGLSIAGTATLLRSEAPAGPAKSVPMKLPDVVQYWTPYLQDAAVFAAPLLIFVAASVYFVIISNGFVMLRNEVDRAWANIDVRLKQRFDLIPNLVANIDVRLKQRFDLIPNFVEICKGYMQPEQRALDAIAFARTNWMSLASGTKAYGGPGSDFGAAAGLSYGRELPFFAGCANFTELQKTITILEDQIADRRELYNATALLIRALRK